MINSKLGWTRIGQEIPLLLEADQEVISASQGAWRVVWDVGITYWASRRVHKAGQQRIMQI